MRENKFICQNIGETRDLALSIANKLKKRELICLYGALGAGKTTFSESIIKYFVKNTRVISPTFIIVRQYDTVNDQIKKIYHIDLYRMDKATDFQSLGLEEIFDDLNALTIIEWADRMVDKLPKNRIDIKITVLESEKRLFEIAYHDR